jgi:hypothetical protein
MNELWRWRNFIGLRQADVERATGISLWKIRRHELYGAGLTGRELEVLVTFYQERLREIALEGVRNGSAHSLVEFRS